MPQTIAAFDGGLNASGAKDKIAPNEVAFAENVDFILEEGAVVSRRGSRPYIVSGLGSAKINDLQRTYNNKYDYGNSPWYIASNGKVYRANDTAVTATIASSTATDVERTAFGWFKTWTLIANGAVDQYWKDDGTNTYEWVTQSPVGALGVALSTLTAMVLGTYWAVTEGIGAAGTATVTASTTEAGRVVFTPTLLTTNLASNGTEAIGDYGIDCLDILFSNPSVVTKISRDYSIGDANFNSYWHTEHDLVVATDAQVPGEVLVENAQSTSNDLPIDIDLREKMLNELRLSPRSAKTVISQGPNTFNLWAVPRPLFELVSADPTKTGWDNIQAARIIIEFSDAAEVRIKNSLIYGAETYPLNDADVGYCWWETWATLDSSGVVLDESAPSPISTRKKMQYCRAVLTSTNTATGTRHGFTHRCFYRQGGYMRDAYLVGTCSLAVATFTDSRSDISVLSTNVRLMRNVHNRITMPSNVVAISEPYFSRTFVAHDNVLMWSEPNKPSVFKKSSYTEVSHYADEIRAVLAFMPSLVIVNRDSIYEFTGSVFDGAQADWTLYRTGARRGSKAFRVPIKTPFGVPLIDYDGLFFYTPGGGVEQKIDWIDSKIGDAWRGELSYDPAALSGSRVPAINKGYIKHSFSVWANNKLYLAVPTGTSTVPNTIFVMDFLKQRVWFHTYPFTFLSGWWDAIDNRIFVGLSDGGKIYEIETNNTDVDSTGADVGVAWKIYTRMWSWPNEARLANMSIDYKGPMTVKVIENGTTTDTSIGTLTSTARTRTMPTLNGSLANYIEFQFAGTNTATDARSVVYGLDWDALEEPPKTLYVRTDYFTYDNEQEWIALANQMDCIGGTVIGVVYLDSTAITTATFTGSGPKGYVEEMPLGTGTGPLNHPFARSGYVVYTATTPFKHYRSWFEVRPEPSRLNHFRTPTFTELQDNVWKNVKTELNCLGGTVTGVVYIDGTAFSTHTFTGSGYVGYIQAFSTEGYGKTAYVIYRSTTVFKHYATEFDREAKPPLTTHVKTDDVFYDGEQEFRAWVNVLDCGIGTVLGTAYVDGTQISTASFTGTSTHGSVVALPDPGYFGGYPHVFGRTAWAVYNSTMPFRHYRTWFEATPEPSRVRYYRTPTKFWDTEQLLVDVKYDIDCGTGTVTAAVWADSTCIETYTLTGSGQHGGVLTLPAGQYGRCGWIVYSASTPFKHYITDFDSIPEPPRLSYKRSEVVDFGAEQEIKAVANELDCLGGVVLGTVYVDALPITVCTFSGAGRVGYVNELPTATGTGPLNHPFGRTAYTIYTSTSTFKEYHTWFETIAEPSRLRHFRTPTTFFPEEMEIRTVKGDLDCYAGTVVGTAYVDSSAVSTFTMSGNGVQGWVRALPPFTTGRSAWVVYNASAKFKHYTTEFDGTPEPPRITSYRVPTKSYPSSQRLRTWVAVLNPLGTMTGTLRAEGQTVVIETFTGTERKTYNIGVDLSDVQTQYGSQVAIDVLYTGSNVFKHYDTDIEVEPMPFGKKTWQITYKKPGGATQLDVARFWELDAEPSTGTATVTSIWYGDDIVLLTNTFTLVGREYIDRISFPPGARGYIFKQHLISDVDLRVWRVNLDMQRIGVKGFSRVSYNGGETRGN